MNTISVVVPIYNEHSTIKRLVEQIISTTPNARITIVDDSDEKSHKKIVQQLEKVKKKSVQIIHRSKKLGRGSAVIAGFRLALQNRKSTLFVEMDGDLSHNPAELITFVKALKADVVVGSRYLSESTIIDWPLYRLFLSKVINVFLEVWLQVGLTDYTNGYRMYSRKAVEFLVKQDLHESGFILLSETAYCLHKAGFQFSEIPITFVDRKHGKSSVTFFDLLLSLFGAIRIRFR